MRRAFGNAALAWYFLQYAPGEVRRLSGVLRTPTPALCR